MDDSDAAVRFEAAVCVIRNAGREGGRVERASELLADSVGVHGGVTKAEEYVIKVSATSGVSVRCAALRYSNIVAFDPCAGSHVHKNNNEHAFLPELQISQQRLQSLAPLDRRRSQSRSNRSRHERGEPRSLQGNSGEYFLTASEC